MVAALVDVLKAEHRRRPVAMLLVEQNVPFAFSLADRFAVLKRGEIVARGSVSDQNARAVVEEHLRV
jgi:branched-chain amino acid transport system ATP-binding protein